MKKIEKNTVRLLGLELPSWIAQACAAISVTTIAYGLIKYTFVGEAVERLYTRATGRSPLEKLGEELKDSLDPREDLALLEEDLRSL